MPLLPPEPFVFPPELLVEPAAADSVAPPEFRWWVLHTRPRTEKALVCCLLGRSVGFFLPQYLKDRLSRGRRFASHLPLFPGYLFLHGGERDRLTALETNLVVNCLPVHDQAQLHATCRGSSD